MLCRLATANAGVCKVLFLERNATRFNSACYVLKLILTLGASAPHSLDKARLILCYVEELLVGSRYAGLFSEILSRSVDELVMHEVEHLADLGLDVVDRNKALVARYAADEHAVAQLKSATHFNPVDLVCCLKDHEGKKFNLLDHVDEETGLISSKSYQGRELKALELPGLWNGSMSDWNTLFVEVPIETFNPVKTVLDLLRPAHQ